MLEEKEESSMEASPKLAAELPQELAEVEASESEDYRNSAGAAVIGQLTSLEKQLEAVEKQGGELMLFQWKLMREQMAAMTGGLADLQRQLAEVRKATHQGFSKVRLELHEVTREVEASREAAGLAQERRLRAEIETEGNVVLKTLRGELQQEISALRDGLLRLEVSSDGFNREASKAIQQEAEERTTALETIEEQLALLRKDMKQGEDGVRETFKDLTEAVEQVSSDQSSILSAVQRRIDALATDLAEPLRADVEDVHRLCQKLSEDASASSSEQRCALEKVEKDASQARALLEQRLVKVGSQLDNEVSERTASLQDLERSLKSSLGKLRGDLASEASEEHAALRASFERQLGGLQASLADLAARAADKSDLQDSVAELEERQFSALDSVFQDLGHRLLESGSRGSRRSTMMTQYRGRGASDGANGSFGSFQQSPAAQTLDLAAAAAAATASETAKEAADLAPDLVDMESPQEPCAPSSTARARPSLTAAAAALGGLSRSTSAPTLRPPAPGPASSGGLFGSASGAANFVDEVAAEAAATALWFGGGSSGSATLGSAGRRSSTPPAQQRFGRRGRGGSEAVVISGHNGARSVNGVYRSLSRTYMDAPVYLCREANSYLFRSARNGSWGIGDRPSGGLLALVQDPARRAYDIRGTWKVCAESGRGWIDDPNLTLLVSQSRCGTAAGAEAVVVESHYSEIEGRYEEVDGEAAKGRAIFVNEDAGTRMYYDGRRWQIADNPPGDVGGFAVCHARSVETTSPRPEDVQWLGAVVYGAAAAAEVDSAGLDVALLGLCG